MPLWVDKIRFQLKNLKLQCTDNHSFWGSSFVASSQKQVEFHLPNGKKVQMFPDNGLHKPIN